MVFTIVILIRILYIFKVYVHIFADFDSVSERSWIDVEFTLSDFTTQLMFEATRGGTTVGEDEGDICIDNIEVTDGHCEGKNNNSDVYIMPTHSIVIDK